MELFCTLRIDTTDFEIQKKKGKENENSTFVCNIDLIHLAFNESGCSKKTQFASKLSQRHNNSPEILSKIIGLSENKPLVGAGKLFDNSNIR